LPARSNGRNCLAGVVVSTAIAPFALGRGLRPDLLADVT
jgi:hypothetical protein